ncbi:MAG TPA: VWA domain-containing protein [Epsilonproteobacteria bacterium]|nr:VWA domain-containing protein [Campylobacterota bacterium]
MTLLYPNILWFLIPLILFFFKSSKKVVVHSHLLILMLILLALARPVQEEALQAANIEARDIIIAVDVSYSMRSSDVRPTRYTFAKETIKRVLKENPTDNVMLMAFTSNPLLLSPPTTDHALINIALENLNPEFILTKGTSLKKLFKKLTRMHQENKTLILITDGGEEHDASSLAEILRLSGMSLITLALGTTHGTTVTTKTGQLLKDKQGNLVISQLNPALEALTSAMQGTYLTAKDTPQQTAQAMTEALQIQTQTQQSQKMQHRYKELYHIPLFVALILFLLLHTRGIRYLLILFAFLGLDVQAGILDTYHLHQAYAAYKQKAYHKSYLALQQIEKPSLQSQMALANVYYNQGSYKKALKIYRTLHSCSTPIKQQIYYNSANAYTRLGLYSKAKSYYTKVLQLGEDKAAKENLKLVTFLADKKSQNLGKAHPKSQNADTSKSLSQEEDKDKNKEEQKSSGSGSGGEGQNKEDEKKNQLLVDDHTPPHPLSSKVYELINKGYIRETHPW